MKKYRITPRAKEDLLNIGQYTLTRWGKDQRNRYLKQLEKRFEWLINNALMGKHRADIQEGFYVFPHEEHQVFYLIHAEGIDIIGIPHKQMDIQIHFKEDVH